MNDVEGDQEGFVEETEEKEEDEGNPQISVYAINGVATKSYQTMRVTMTVNKKPLHILNDSGSTHNFLDVRVAKKLGCKVEEMGPMKVDVANGGNLKCMAICKGLTWTLQGTKFVTNVLLLP